MPTSATPSLTRSKCEGGLPSALTNWILTSPWVAFSTILAQGTNTSVTNGWVGGTQREKRQIVAADAWPPTANVPVATTAAARSMRDTRLNIW